MKKALITGVTGQDGAYLAEFLSPRDTRSTASSGARRCSTPPASTTSTKTRTSRIRHFILHYGDMTDSSSLIHIVQKVQPDEIYNLAAQSHVQVSFEEPEYTANSDALGVLRLLEAIRILGLEKKTRFYQASTSELYGLVQEIPQKETTPFYPRSPYAVAKMYGYLDRRQLPRSLRHVRLQRHPLQPRVAHARRDLRHPQDHARAGAHQGRPAGAALPRQPRRQARLGPRPRLRRDAVADAAAGEAAGLRHRHRPAVQRSRVRPALRRAARA